MREADDDYAIIGGGGMSGLCQLYHLREPRLRVSAIEAGTRIGGTWYWNHCPVARVDSESCSSAKSFSHELLDGWTWSEHFAGQPETERCISHVTSPTGSTCGATSSSAPGCFRRIGTRRSAART